MSSFDLPPTERSREKKKHKNHKPQVVVVVVVVVGTGDPNDMDLFWLVDDRARSAEPSCPRSCHELAPHYFLFSRRTPLPGGFVFPPALARPPGAPFSVMQKWMGLSWRRTYPLLRSASPQRTTCPTVSRSAKPAQPGLAWSPPVQAGRARHRPLTGAEDHASIRGCRPGDLRHPREAQLLTPSFPARRQ